MVAGYANLAEDFATDEQAFQKLLEHTRIADKRGTTAVALETMASSGPANTKGAGAAAPAATEPDAPSAPTGPSAPPPQ
jgi:hypothetical protein